MVVGLGNPGPRYENTRHNAGFIVVEKLAARLGLSFKREKLFEAELAKYGDEKGQLFLLKPQTYMNESGRAVSRLASYYKVRPEDVLVVVDDVALETGTLRFRPEGSHGGHNGLRSMAAHFGQKYPRLRVGVGEAKGPHDLSHHVLSSFSKKDLELLEPAFEKAADAIMSWRYEDNESLMNWVNTKPS